MAFKKSVHCFLLLALACGIALLIRLPSISADLPFIYQEDDGHHFNRTVEMYKRGSLDPIDYFNKPSLHFYLRLPVVAASVQDALSKGELQSKKELRTRDPYGLSGYAYTVSHPGILWWNRAFSVFLSLLVVTVTFLGTLLLTRSPYMALFGALLPTLSLEVVKNSHLIGVDVIMALMCLLSSTASLLLSSKYPRAALVLSSLFAGLAASSKYNAAPIAIVPTLTALVSFPLYKIRALAAAGGITILAFFLGSPFILLHPAEAWNDIKYELWHYGAAGHIGHSTERGLPQALFYSDWLLTDGIGISCSFLALLGVIVLLFSKSSCKKILPEQIFISFPLAYIALMVMQKTNFTRNMVVVVPYLGVAAACGLQYALSAFKDRSIIKPIAFLACSLALYPLLISDLHFLEKLVTSKDSRTKLARWVQSERLAAKDVAINGEFQFPISFFSLKGVDAFNPEKVGILELFNRGYTYVVTTPSDATKVESALDLIQSSQLIPGSSTDLRIPINPSITILTLKEPLTREEVSRLPAQTLSITPNKDSRRLGCEKGEEDTCWLRGLFNKLVLENTNMLPPLLTFELVSPWNDQRVIFEDKSGNLVNEVRLQNSSDPFVLSLPIEYFPISIKLSRVHSPEGQGINEDTRRLGVSFKYLP
jgi:hypothetical protein